MYSAAKPNIKNSSTNGFRCHLAGTVIGVSGHIVSERVPDSQQKSRFGGQILNQIMELQITVKPSILCYHLANKNEDSDSTFYQIILVLVLIVINSLTLRIETWVFQHPGPGETRTVYQNPKPGLGQSVKSAGFGFAFLHHFWFV